PIFLEEAAELFPQAGEQLRAWRHNPANADAAQALRRSLHTFKGSARMAGAMRLGELTHGMESRLLAGDALAKPTPELFDTLDTDLDRLAFVLDRLQKGEVNTPLPWLETAAAPAPAAPVPLAVVAAGPVVPLPAVAAPAAAAASAAAAAPPEAEAARVAVLRVRAGLSDRPGNRTGR